MKEFESCEKCKYSSKSYYEYPCEICVHGCAVKEYYVPMTNADRIRGMTDEGLADFLCSVKTDYQWINQDYPSEEETGEWIEWLQSEADQKGQEL